MGTTNWCKVLTYSINSAEFKAPLTTTFKGKADWAAFCVDVGQNCYVEPASGITTGNYTVMKELIEFTVALDPAVSEYSCYVATVLSKGMVCSDPVDLPLKQSAREYSVGPQSAGQVTASSTTEAVKPAPKTEVTTPPKKVAAPKPEITTPPKKAAAPQPEITTPPKKVAAPQPEIKVPPKKIAAPQPEIKVPPKKAAAPQPEIKVPPKKVVISAPAPEVEAPPKKVVAPEAPKKPVSEAKTSILDQPLADDQVINDNVIIA